MKIKRLPNLDFNRKLSPDIAGWAKQAREDCGLSQMELAELLGLESAAAICHYERGNRKISSWTLWAISQITNQKPFFFQEKRAGKKKQK